MSPAPIDIRIIEQIDGWLSLEEAACLFDLASQVTDSVIVEIGTYRGRSTVALALGSRAGSEVPVYAIDPHEDFIGPLGGVFGPNDRAEFYRTMLKTECFREVRLLNVTSEVIAPGWNLPIGLLWIDGDHDYKAVRRDFYCWEPYLIPECFIIFDDTNQADLGPAILVSELLASGVYEVTRTVGKITSLRRNSSID